MGSKGHHPAPLPSEQHAYPGLPALDERTLHARRERLFLLFAGLFLGTLAMLNILGITRFLVLASWGPARGGGNEFRIGEPNFDSAWNFALAVGVLPYPITFLCTDFISELWGRARANTVVFIGFILNLWVILILWVGGVLPGFAELDPTTGFPPAPEWDAEKATFVESGWTFFQLRNLAFGAVAASMIAYLAAQLVDVHVFHFWKRLTNGRHKWLRNNGSTLVSQAVDTTAVILITHYYAHALPVNPDQMILPQLMIFIATGYAFKMLAALLDTLPFYAFTPLLCRYLRLPQPGKHPPLGSA